MKNLTRREFLQKTAIGLVALAVPALVVATPVPMPEQKAIKPSKTEHSWNDYRGWGFDFYLYSVFDAHRGILDYYFVDKFSDWSRVHNSHTIVGMWEDESKPSTVVKTRFHDPMFAITEDHVRQARRSRAMTVCNPDTSVLFASRHIDIKENALYQAKIKEMRASIDKGLKPQKLFTS